jgi:hypothetical protein
VTNKITNKGLPNDPSMFPPPATWLSWVREHRQVPRLDKDGNHVTQEVTYTDHLGNSRTYQQTVYDPVQLEDGKIRHHYTRAVARKSLMGLGRDSKDRGDQRGLFYCDWAVYEWVDGEWILRGSGKKGEARKTNPWFAQKVTKEERKHPFDKAQEQKAIESILKAVG